MMHMPCTIEPIEQTLVLYALVFLIILISSVGQVPGWSPGT
jgi:hypothetical protein